jgi:hypothetical protein
MPAPAPFGGLEHVAGAGEAQVDRRQAEIAGALPNSATI